MARRRTPQPLGDILSGFIKRTGLKPRIDEARIVEAWAIMAGPQINGITASARFKHGRLYIKITSAPWRNELHLRRSAWCQQLNQHLGEDLVQEILFR